MWKKGKNRAKYILNLMLIIKLSEKIYKYF